MCEIIENVNNFFLHQLVGGCYHLSLIDYKKLPTDITTCPNAIYYVHRLH